MWSWAGGVTRETVCCKDCGTKKLPLKWYQFWEKWLCTKCFEWNVYKEMEPIYNGTP
jgi:hypothetical protein